MWYRRITAKDEQGNRYEREFAMGSNKDAMDYNKFPPEYWKIVHSGGYLGSYKIQKEK